MLAGGGDALLTRARNPQKFPQSDSRKKVLRGANHTRLITVTAAFPRQCSGQTKTLSTSSRDMAPGRAFRGGRDW
jgi:hypothetical protein